MSSGDWQVVNDITDTSLKFAIISRDYVFDSVVDCWDHLCCCVTSDYLFIIFGPHASAITGATAVVYTLAKCPAGRSTQKRLY